MRNRKKFLYLLVILVLLVSLSVLSAKILFSISNGYGLHHVSGAWTASALDLANGVFYRPLFSDNIGFGGTRFFPLFFSLHALVFRLLGMIIFSGYIVTFLSGILLFSSFYLLLWRSGASFLVCFIFCVLLLSSQSIQHGLQSIRGDILPLAINMSGILIYISFKDKKYRILFSSLCFIFAFSSKMTSISGIVSILLWILINKDIKNAVYMFLTTFLGCSLFIIFVNFFTKGRFLHIFQVCSTEGIDFISILKSPTELMRNIQYNDPVCVMFITLAIISIFNINSNKVKNIINIYFVVSFFITLMIFSSRGIDSNHLVDISSSSLLVVGYYFYVLQNNKAHYMRKIGVYILFLALATSFSLPEFKKQLFVAMKIENAERVFIPPSKLIERVKKEDGIILSENPFIPIIANKSPYILDPFMLRVVMNKEESIKLKMIESIKEKKYSLIIFQNDPVSQRKIYSYEHFGDDFISAVFEHYKKDIQHDGYFLYSPK